MAVIVTTVRLSEETAAALDAIGSRDDRSRSWLIRKAVEEYVELHGVKNPPAATQIATSESEAG